MEIKKVVYRYSDIWRKMDHAYLLVEPLELFAKWCVVDRRSLHSFDYHIEREVMMSPLGNLKVKDVLK